MSNQPGSLVLNGVHHSARPTWKLRETVEFYRDIMGLKLIHAVSARGWGPSAHPDFLHFFFDSGKDSTIAFFYYLGAEQAPHLVHRPEYDSDASHTSWQVSHRDQLLAWRERLERNGVDIMYQIEHEVIESIYFRDPNGYYLEIALPLRGFSQLDAMDAERTIEAAIEVEDEYRTAGKVLDSIEAVWQRKGRNLMASLEISQEESRERDH